MLSAINRYFPAGTRTSRPTGGFVLWFELPEGSDSKTLSGQALAAGISFTPDRLFSPHEKYGNCLRLAAALPWAARGEEALAAQAELARLAGRGLPTNKPGNRRWY